MGAFGELRPTVLQCAIEDGVGWIRMNRAPVNAIDLGLLQELVQAVQAARVDPAVKAVMFSSQIPGYFSAGLDLKEMEDPSDEGRAELIDQLFKDGLIRAMRTARKVFIALINGHCLGGGLELALAADFRVGGQGKWQIGLPEVRLGGMPGGGGIQMLSRLIGQSRTLRMTLLGETVAEGGSRYTRVPITIATSACAMETIKFLAYTPCWDPYGNLWGDPVGDPGVDHGQPPRYSNGR